MDMHLELKQSQLLTMAMQNSLELLKMNNLELNDYLKDFACGNAMVDLEYPSVSFHPSPFHTHYTASRTSDPSDADTTTKENLMWDKASDISALQDLHLQAATMHLPPQKEQLVRYLIDALDEDGFLNESPEELSQHLQISADRIQEAVLLLRRMDPAGIGSRNAMDCLYWQLERYHPQEKLAMEILKFHADFLASGKYAALAKKLHVTENHIRNACEIIRSLDPKPLNGSGGNPSTSYILPDFYVIQEEDSKLVIQMNDYYLPKLQINPQYYQLLQSESLSAEDLTFLKTNYQQASDVMRFLTYRVSTLQRVAEYLVAQQTAFFLHGPGHRRSLYNRDAAEALTLHESTVSRAVSGKYFECKWGVFPLKELFCHSLSSSNQEACLDYDQVLMLLQDIVSREPKGKAYSDQKIANLMLAEGIEISRRTVVKYRQQLGIPSSTQRNVGLK